MRTHFLFAFVILLFSSCENPNIRLQEYPKKKNFDGNPFFSIDSTLNNNIYLTKEIPFPFSNNLMEISKFSFYVRDNKFFAKAIKPKSEEFILFDLKSRLEKINKIEFKSAKIKKHFYCILEKRILTNDKLEVCVFRIKKWAKLSDHFGVKELDIIVFVTQNYGVIGSYTTDLNETGNPIMISPKGDILKDYIDYSKIREAALL